MDGKPMNRKEFLTNVGKACACACVGAIAANLSSVYAADTTKATGQKPEPEPAKKPRSQERIEFTERWVVRFFDVLDANLDEPTRLKVMMANGKSCLLAWQKDTNQQQRTEPVTLERLAAWAKQHPEQGYEVDGNIVYSTYTSAAETGLPSPDNHCLCPMVETNPKGLSPTYCLCSLGYVKEMHEQMFKKPVQIELLNSALRGDPRCKFKMTVG